MRTVDDSCKDKRFVMLKQWTSHIISFPPFQEGFRLGIKLPDFKQMRWEDVEGFVEQ